MTTTLHPRIDTSPKTLNMTGGLGAAGQGMNTSVMSLIPSAQSSAPDDIDFAAIMQLMTSKYTEELIDRHVAAIRRVCKTCCNGFLLKHLEPLVDLMKLVVERFAKGQHMFAHAICEVTRVASQPFVSCKASDMITHGQHLPVFIKVIVSILHHALPPTEESFEGADQDPEARALLEEHKATCERIRIEIAHTLACWSRFGLDEESVELRPHQPLIQAVADSGTPNLRILRQSQVMDALSASFRVEDSPEAIVITLGAIRDMSLHRPLARQITNSGLISNLVHVIRVNLLGSDVLLVAAEVLWNVLELDWEGASEAMGQEEVMECFRDFMAAVLSSGYRFKDKVFRNDMMVLLMYISKREENRPLFASTGLMALLVGHAVGEAQRRRLHDTGVMDALLASTTAATASGADGGGSKKSSEKAVQLTSSQEDMEFRMLLWGVLARCCSSEPCAQVAVHCGFVPSLLLVLDAQEVPPEQRQWSQEQRRKVQLEALSALFQLVQYVPDAFMEAQGCAVVLQLLQQTRSREVQKKCLNLLQVAVRQGPQFAEEFGKLGAVGLLVELFADKDNPMTSRQLCASVLGGLCDDNAENRREFRKKDGVEAIRAEVVYRPDETTDNHLFYTLCVVDCVWSAIVGTRKNEIRFLDAGGLFALLDVLEVAPLLLKRQIIGCLADLMQYRKANRLFVQWNSQVTMKGGLKILLELWQSEQEAAGSAGEDGVIRDVHRPLNPQVPEFSENSPTNERPGTCSSDGSMNSSRASMKLRQARSYAESNVASPPAKQMGKAASSGVAATGRSPATGTSPPKGRGKAGAEPGPTALDRQDSRAKIYAVLATIGFECQESLTIAERQQMELVKQYPQAAELEMWIEVKEHLDARGVKPIAADRKWIEDSITERKELAAQVQSLQKNLADDLHNEELGSLNRFYEDVRSRAQFRTRAEKAEGLDSMRPDYDHDSSGEGF